MISRLTSDGADGIRDYTMRLCEELAARGVRVDIVTRQGGRWKVSWVPSSTSGGNQPKRTDAGHRAVVIQYNPFMYGRWGVAPQLMLHAWRMRRSGERIFLMVHEPFMPFTGWRETVMGLWQRIQLRWLALLSESVITSVDGWARRFGRWHPRRPTVHLPVASNLPDMRAGRVASRARLGVDDGDLVVATLGTDHPSHLREHVRQAMLAIASRRGGRVLLLELGARSRRFGTDELAGVTVLTPGAQPADELAAGLASADVFLAALLDGATTRRTTLMAALQHGLPVVATTGPLTDPVLRRSREALILVPADDLGGFASSAATLSVDQADRERRAIAARDLYVREFDWPVHTNRLLGVLDGQRWARW